MTQEEIKTSCEPMQLTSENVESVFKDCLGGKEEGALIIHGVMMRVAFDRNKVSDNRDNIRSMLAQLPESFYADKGGGWSFLNLCVDKYGRQWTGLHQMCDKLVCLGLAIGAIKFCIANRDFWAAFSGGLPYLAIDLKKRD